LAFSAFISRTQVFLRRVLVADLHSWASPRPIPICDQMLSFA
jgi:hypothetical protein